MSWTSSLSLVSVVGLVMQLAATKFSAQHRKITSSPAVALHGRHVRWPCRCCPMCVVVNVHLLHRFHSAPHQADKPRSIRAVQYKGPFTHTLRCALLRCARKNVNLSINDAVLCTTLIIFMPPTQRWTWVGSIHGLGWVTFSST